MQNKEIVNLLKDLKNTFNLKYAIVAGGACRDELLNRYIKDYDIYIDQESLEDTLALNGNLRDKFQKFFNDRNYYFNITYGHNAYTEDWISSVTKIQSYNRQLQIDLICTKECPSPISVVDKFDIDLCKVFYCPNTGFYKTNEFIKDTNNQTITMNIPKKFPILEKYFGYIERMCEHMKRVHLKYPEFKCNYNNNNSNVKILDACNNTYICQVKNSVTNMIYYFYNGTLIDANRLRIIQTKIGSELYE